MHVTYIAFFLSHLVPTCTYVRLPMHFIHNYLYLCLFTYALCLSTFVTMSVYLCTMFVYLCLSPYALCLSTYVSVSSSSYFSIQSVIRNVLGRRAQFEISSWTPAKVCYCLVIPKIKNSIYLFGLQHCFPFALATLLPLQLFIVVKVWCYFLYAIY